MEVKIQVSDKLAAEARAQGVPIEVYVQEILARQATGATSEVGRRSVNATIDRIKQLRKGNKLADLRIKDLIHEGHK